MYKEGLEADDLLTIEQMKDPFSSIICSVDKDLRIAYGWHYTWEVGSRGAIGPIEATPKGWLEPVFKGFKSNGDPKVAGLKGYGTMFFGAQLLMGDSVDNIKGVERCGPAKAYELLKDVEKPSELFSIIAEQYVKAYGDDAATKMLEMGQLLWMIRELDENGEPVMWELPKAAKEVLNVV